MDSMFKLRIGFNITPYRNTRSGGMLHYALSMLREFADTIPEQVTLFSARHSRKLLRGIEGLSELRRREIREPSEIFRYRHEFEVLFTPAAWGGVTLLDYPTIHVIPDIQEHYYPQFFSERDFQNRRLYHTWGAKASTLLITLSEFSKRTMIEKLGIHDKKVRVTHLAAHPIFSDESVKGVRPANMPEVKEFLFYPANSWRHKNHVAVLDALVDLRARHGLHVPVIFSGDLLDGEDNHVDILCEIRARSLEKQVFHIGRTDLKGLKFLYLNAAALIHPSLYEGFGIPLVEAMSSGCPVIAARATSIPEVCGDSALYFDPQDREDLSEKISHFFNHPDDALMRCKSGKERALQFSDSRVAAETLDILTEAYERAGELPLQKRIGSLRAQHDSPVLSVLASPGANHPDRSCSTLTTLQTEVGDLLEVICIGGGERLNQCHAVERSACIRVRDCPSMDVALKRAMDVSKGRYVLFADSNSLPLKAFVLHLAELLEQGDLPEMLHGESYTYHPRTGRYEEGSGPTGEDDAETLQTNCCSRLSLVIRSDVFSRFLNGSSHDWNSLREIAAALWPVCQKQLIYTVVNCVSHEIIARNELDRLTKEVPPESIAGRVIGTNFGSVACYHLMRIQMAMPIAVREVTRMCWRALRNA